MVPAPSVPSRRSRARATSATEGSSVPDVNRARVAITASVALTSWAKSRVFRGERFAPMPWRRPSLSARAPKRLTTWRKTWKTKLWPRYLPGTTKTSPPSQDADFEIVCPPRAGKVSSMRSGVSNGARPLRSSTRHRMGITRNLPSATPKKAAGADTPLSPQASTWPLMVIMRATPSIPRSGSFTVRSPE